MGTVREHLIKPFRSGNDHFEFDFKFDSEISDRGIVDITFLKTNNFKTYEFVLDSTGSIDILRIKGVLIKRVENDGFDGGINKPWDEAIYHLRYGISDPNIL